MSKVLVLFISLVFSFQILAANSLGKFKCKGEAAKILKTHGLLKGDGKENEILCSQLIGNSSGDLETKSFDHTSGSFYVPKVMLVNNYQNGLRVEISQRSLTGDVVRKNIILDQDCNFRYAEIWTDKGKMMVPGQRCEDFYKIAQFPGHSEQAAWEANIRKIKDQSPQEKDWLVANAKNVYTDICQPYYSGPGENKISRLTDSEGVLKVPATSSK